MSQWLNRINFMSTTTLRLFLIRETEMARLYSSLPPERRGPDDQFWVPKSIIEHTTKRGDEHMVKLPDWYVEKEGI